MTKPLSALISEIRAKEEEIASLKANPPTVGAYVSGHETRVSNMETDVISLKKEYVQSLRQNTEVILVDGPGVSSALQEFQDLGVITINAQSIFELAASRASAISGSTTYNSDTFLELATTIGELSRATGVRLPQALQFNYQQDATTPLATIFREEVRKQVGGAGAEPTAVYLDLSSKALAQEAAVDPLPVVVYNIAGASVNDYKTTFNSVHSVSLETGDESEVKKALKTVFAEVKKQGKLNTKTKSEQEGTK